MYYLLGFRECLKNVSVLSKNYHGDCLKSLDELKIAFGLFLNNFQPKVPHKPFSDLFVKDESIFRKLMDLYNAPSTVNDRNQDSMLEEMYATDLIESNIIKINKILSALENQNLAIHTLFNLVMHSIFFAHSQFSGGGTTSSGIGVLWLNTRPHWSDQDILELLIHEMTHTCVFIDEVIHVHINDYNLIAKEENYAQSAILSKKRPVDKVYHSIIVSVEVLESRLDFIGEQIFPKVHPPTEKLIIQTRSSLESLFALENYDVIFSPRCKELMKMCNQRLNDINHRFSLIDMSQIEGRECRESSNLIEATI
jgi:hypothetical protein